MDTCVGASPFKKTHGSISAQEHVWDHPYLGAFLHRGMCKSVLAQKHAWEQPCPGARVDRGAWTTTARYLTSQSAM